MKRTSIARTLTLLVAGTCLSAVADINWYVLPPSFGGSGMYNDASLGGALLTGDNADASVGFFVQLIEDVGLDGPDAVIASGNGIPAGANDLVASTAWVGKETAVGGATEGANGWLNTQFFDYTPDNVVKDFYLRAWNAPSPDYATGLIPVGASVFFGNSAVVRVDRSSLPQPPPPYVDFGTETGPGGIVTDQPLAIPEPTVAALLLVGLGGLVARRRLRMRA